MITPETLAKSGSEHGEQAAVFCWASMREQQSRFPDLRWMFAIPNGGLRNKVTASMLKAEGVKAGVPDIMLPVPKSCFAGLFVEMKKANATPSAVRPDQIDYLHELRKQRYAAHVAFGWRQAVEIIESYLLEKPIPLEFGRSRNAV